MNKDVEKARAESSSIPVPDIYSQDPDDRKTPESKKPASTAPEYHEPEGFDPYDTASLHQK